MRSFRWQRRPHPPRASHPPGSKPVGVRVVSPAGKTYAVDTELIEVDEQGIARYAMVDPPEGITMAWKVLIEVMPGATGLAIPYTFLEESNGPD